MGSETYPDVYMTFVMGSAAVFQATIDRPAAWTVIHPTEVPAYFTQSQYLPAKAHASKTYFAQIAFLTQTSDDSLTATIVNASGAKSNSSISPLSGHI